MYDRVVADNAILAYRRRIPGVRVQHAAVLNVRARPYAYWLRVPPQHGSIPHARLFPQIHRPDEVGPRRHEAGLRNFRSPVIIWQRDPAAQDLELHQHGVVPPNLPHGVRDAQRITICFTPAPPILELIAASL
jgi:hypothetical protein